VTDALPNPGSSAYWERRYRKGSRSCPGAAFSRLARCKAEAVNRAVWEDDNVIVNPVKVLDNKSFADFHIHSRP
jgi:hypothetical protein